MATRKKYVMVNDHELIRPLELPLDTFYHGDIKTIDFEQGAWNTRRTRYFLGWMMSQVEILTDSDGGVHTIVTEVMLPAVRARADFYKDYTGKKCRMVTVRKTRYYSELIACHCSPADLAIDGFNFYGKLPDPLVDDMLRYVACCVAQPAVVAAMAGLG